MEDFTPTQTPYALISAKSKDSREQLQALLLDKGLSAKTHAGTIHIIGQQFVSTGMIDKTYGRLFSRLYELRQSGDYDDMYNATEDEVKPYFPLVESFISVMEELITFK